MTSPEFQWLEDDVMKAVEARIGDVREDVGRLEQQLAEAAQKAMIAEAKHRDRAQVASATSADWEARAMADRATNVELTKKIGELNARIDELTAKPEEPKLVEPKLVEPKLVEARCPDCGGACVHYGSGWHCDVHRDECDNVRTMPDHEVWRRPEDVAEAGKYWVVWSGSDKMTLGSLLKVEMVRSNIRWVLGPLPEPHAPGVVVG